MAENGAEENGVAPSDAMDVDPKPMQSIETDPNQEDDGEDDNEDAGSDADDGDSSGRAVSNQLYKALKDITDVLTNYKIKVKHRNTEEDHYPSTLFKRLPNKRNLPDYYTVITRPSALSTLKGKIQRKQYTGVPEFVEDFALIVHNAQVYNRPNSAPVRDVMRLDAIFKEEMKKLVDKGLVSEEQTVYPDLGEIPYATPEPDPVSEDDEDADEEQEEDEDDEADDSDNDRRRKRGRRGRASIGGRKADKDEDDDNEKAGDAEQKRRGRPPKVDTPMEARIKAILKGLRKYRNNEGLLLIYDFEKLPDKAEHPQYYAVIQNPMALDGIKKKAKRKKYDTVDQFMKDITIMFENALLYNEDGSAIHTNASELLEEAKSLAKIEKDKPDSEYLMQDGRLPLPFIQYNGKMWRVGDWIHIQNPNDVTKPIVAQIYRTWQDPDERKWINACWYYRPEQTVHQYEKHFFPSEVVKTGQYRDHPIEEVIDKCFVMFFTRFGKGRPRGLDPADEVYVCESRYNEEKFKFNKIKTWASCLPDEVRDKDYEMDLFDVPRKVKKVPSPLLYMLKDDAKEDDELPQPVWGNPNAPPKQGGIHKRPRDENQSPPPEPTPPPPPTPPPVVRQPSANLLPPHQAQPGLARQASITAPTPSHMSRPSPSVPPQTPYQNNVTPPNTQYTRNTFQPAAASGPYNMNQPAHPVQAATAQYNVQHQAANFNTHHSNSYPATTPNQAFPRATIQAYQAQQVPQQPIHHPYATPYTPGVSGNEGRQREVYVLSDAANESIPSEIRDRYPKDAQGRVLWFTQPPIYDGHGIEDTVDPRGRGKPLQHSEQYIEAKASKEELLRKVKHDEQGSRASEIRTQQDSISTKRKSDDDVPMTNGDHREVSKRTKNDEPALKKMTNAEVIAILKTGAKRSEKNGYKIQDFWTGKYLDDYDPRLPPFN